MQGASLSLALAAIVLAVLRESRSSLASIPKAKVWLLTNELRSNHDYGQLSVLVLILLGVAEAMVTLMNLDCRQFA